MTLSTNPSDTAHLSQTDRPARRAMPDTKPLTDDELRAAIADCEAAEEGAVVEESVADLRAWFTELLELRQKLSTARDALAGYHLLIEGDPHDGDSGRSTGSAGDSNGGSSERVGYILGRQGDLGDWVITDPCIPWADPADAENARADAEGYGVPGVTAHVLAVYREDGTR